MTEESTARAQIEAEDWHRRHDHELHHRIAARAFELHDATVKAHGIDYGEWFYWFSAEWLMGLIPNQPLPPPVE